MGTCTVTLRKRHLGVGAGIEVFADISPSTSYLNGTGETLTLKSLGLDSLQALIVCSNTGGFNYQVVHGATERTDPLIKIFQGDNANAGAGPGIEVPNATNLSAQVIRVIAKGNYAYV